MTISPNSDEVQKRISLEQYYHTLILSIFLIIRLDICHCRKALSLDSSKRLLRFYSCRKPFICRSPFAVTGGAQADKFGREGYRFESSHRRSSPPLGYPMYIVIYFINKRREKIKYEFDG